MIEPERSVLEKSDMQKSKSVLFQGSYDVLQGSRGSFGQDVKLKIAHKSLGYKL